MLLSLTILYPVKKYKCYRSIKIQIETSQHTRWQSREVTRFTVCSPQWILKDEKVTNQLRVYLLHDEILDNPVLQTFKFMTLILGLLSRFPPFSLKSIDYYLKVGKFHFPLPVCMCTGVYIEARGKHQVPSLKSSIYSSETGSLKEPGAKFSSQQTTVYSAFLNIRIMDAPWLFMHMLGIWTQFSIASTLNLLRHLPKALNQLLTHNPYLKTEMFLIMWIDDPRGTDWEW